ncbi:MAG: DUF2236 domain-containing protein [Gammaproteobacteria bacterium]|nr:DUF2236 domain-containing protein [Gammaproteobacteria bacterium]MYD76629.1 DUF2236 domain-containing protein [Gammaproteobacteria bacterium]MYJ53159.1 DUF2236 domain-containing protein [Gammaproteobacteria bacterium]
MNTGEERPMQASAMPSAYLPGYGRAHAVDPEAADNYVLHGFIGDPELDPVMEDVSSLRPGELHRFITAGMEQDDAVLHQAPESLRRFFEDLKEPAWLDQDAFRPGVAAFHAQVDRVLSAFVAGVLVEGFSTLIAKSFRMTGRVQSTGRRLMQNNRHVMEIFFPGGLLRENDGWKTSVRIRFVHARIRGLLSKHDEWDHEAWGVPLSASNLGLAISVFSKRLLEYSKILGSRFSAEEEESILAIWRYTGYLMGIPESILYTDAASAERIYKIGFLCEPPADEDSATMANALINSIPDITQIKGPKERKSTLDLAYRLSRAIIGNDLANRFEYPKMSTFGIIPFFRMKQYMKQRWRKADDMVRINNFSQLILVSLYDQEGIEYNLPDHVKHEKSHPW